MRLRHRRQLEHSRFQLTHEIRLKGERARDGLTKYAVSSDICCDMIRMSPEIVMKLCDLLTRDGGLKLLYE